MPHPSIYAKTHPDKAAYIMSGTGETVTYLQLEKRSNVIAHLFRSFGLKPKDHVAIMMENHSRFWDFIWGAIRSGIIITPISTHLLEEEVAYILENCKAKLFVTTIKYTHIAKKATLQTTGINYFLMIDGEIPGYNSFDEAISGMPDTPIKDEIQGTTMLYSSGTTGLPKGVYTPPNSESIQKLSPVLESMGQNFKFGPHVTYLSPAPLYHAAPLAFNMVNMMYGGTSIMTCSK